MAPLTHKQKKYIRKASPDQDPADSAKKLGVSEERVREQTGAPASGGDAPRRLWMFWLVLLLMPLLFFAALEGGLRLFHYGQAHQLVLLRDVGGEKYYQLNRQVARRYFTGDGVAVPDARSEAFAYHKTPNTYRIFCLGGSTTAGWPYQHNAGFPSQLQARLSLLFPDKNFEVINAGVSAINSFSVVEFARELVRYQPDLFLIYMGHNEYYGALGVASTQGGWKNRTLIKSYLALSRLKTFQLLRDFLALFKPKPQAAATGQTLMEQIAADKKISYGSEVYKKGVEFFTANLTEILDILQEHQVPVLVSTLASNIADQAPFETVFSDNFTAQNQWKSAMDRGDAAFAAKEWGAAISHYGAALALDELPAETAFKLGKCHEALGDFRQARLLLERGRDLDALRFRASSEFNQVIWRVCRQLQVPVVDAENNLAGACEQGLIGYTVMTEHLHPNKYGYFLMADAFCRAMAEHGLVVSTDQWPWQRDLPASTLMEQAYITPLEDAIAYERVRQLTGRYPYKKPRSLQIDADPEYKAFLAPIVAGVLRHAYSWNEGHYRVAEYLSEHNRHEEAAAEYQAVIRVLPGNYYPYIYLANALILQNKNDEAEKALLTGARFSADLPFAFAKLGVLYMTQNLPNKAKPVLERAIGTAGNSAEFTNNDKARVHFLYALALAQTNEIAKAKNHIHIAARLDPGDPRIQNLMAQLESVAP